MVVRDRKWLERRVRKWRARKLRAAARCALVRQAQGRAADAARRREE
ncbi:hypothetical protein [Desulfovirgula thermocuniculi]|nr:hypothetical protein [Desulfovirgula thermocuniculi]